MRNMLICLLLLLAPAAQALDLESTLTRAISSGIEQLGDLGRYELTIEERSGAVILTGIVETSRARDLIALSASKTDGVRSVENRIEVRAASEESTLLRKVREGIGQRSWGLEIAFKEGLLTLEGEAPDAAQKIEVEKLAQTAIGKGKLRSLITVQAEAMDSVVHARLQESFKNSGYSVPAGVSYKVSNGTVFFSGTVSNHRLIDDLLSHTLMVEGVKDVKSDVKIGG